MNGINSIKNNLISIQLEQLMTIKKEVLHIKRISNFFSLSNSNPYYKTHQNIIKQIETIINSIKKLKDVVNAGDISNLLPYKFLIIYQNNNNNIEKVLFNLRHVREQISQYNESSFNQYLPKPYVGRRYSSKAISIFIEAVTTEILDKNNNDILTSLLWDYRSGFESHFTNNDTYCTIETSFYYYELPYFIPNLFHELNHILLKPENVDSPYSGLRQKFIYTIETFNKYEPIVEIDKGLAEEIVSDIFAYDLLGYSYVFSLFYSIVSDGIPNLFYNPKNGAMDSLPNFIGPEMDDPRLQDIVQSVFEVQLRLALLVEYALNDEVINDIDIYQELENINEFLGYIFRNPINNIHLSLLNVYDRQKENKKNGFNALAKGFNNITEQLMQQLSKHKKNTLSLDMDYKNIFSSIWKDKLSNQNNIFHRNILRKGILEQIFKDHKDIDKMLFEPAELTFFKFNVLSDSNEKSIDKYFQNFTGYNSEDDKDYKQFECFGIYNNLAIRNKSEFVTKKKVESFLEKCSDFETSFYTYKVAMTKMHTVYTKLTASNAFGAIIQLQLKDYDQKTIIDGYNKIREFLDKEKRINYDLYKVLGPSDYIVVLNNITLPKIYEIKKLFFNDKSNVFRRTFTNIFRMNDDSKPRQEDMKNKILVSKIRLKYSIVLEDLKEKEIFFEEKNMGTFQDHCENIFCVPGAIDIEVQWKMYDYSIVKKILQNLSDNISDVQTEYIKIL